MGRELAPRVFDPEEQTYSLEAGQRTKVFPLNVGDDLLPQKYSALSGVLLEKNERITHGKRKIAEVFRNLWIIRKKLVLAKLNNSI